MQERTMDLEARLRVCERRVIALSATTLAMAIIAGALASYQFAPRLGAQSPPSIRASEIVIVDPKGVERVRIGGQLPDATPGKPRGDRVAGVLLYDQTGRERSGYVTFESSGNVGLTLDGRQRQTAFFLAGPTGGTALRMWRGNDWIELRTDEGGARVGAVRANELVFRQPPPTDGEVNGYCANLKAEFKQAGAPDSLLLPACRQRFTAQDCQTCIAGK
jgi:hypothetical protein